MLVKMCGFSNYEDARSAEKSGAAFVGFMFWPSSKRYVAPETVADIIQHLGRIRKVGVFVDEDPEVVNRIAEQCQLDYVQLHGHEPIDYAKKIDYPIIKAFRYGDDFTPEAANEYPCELVLIDKGNKAAPGGAGEVFDWRQAAPEIKKVKRGVIVAGGINSSNVADVYRILHPFAVDASSGLETDGSKDIKKIKAFMRVVKNLDNWEI